MSRVYQNLRSKNPIPEFDDNVQFFDYIVVNELTGRYEFGLPVNQQTGELLVPALPADCEIANHRYFYKNIPVRGSVTQMKYFEKFDADFHSRRIAYGIDIFQKPGYKYHHTGRDVLAHQWPVLRAAASTDKHLLYENVDKHYDEMDTWDADEENPRAAVFRKIHDPLVAEAIKKAWEKNRDDAGELGTAMHNSFQAYYEDPTIDLKEPRFQTPEFAQFLRFNERWVKKRGLKVFRTELSMIDTDSLICGTIDVLYEVEGARKPDEPIPIVLLDYKRTVDTSTTSFRGNEFGNPPFEDWQACKTSERWLQLLVYKKIFEKNTGGRYRVVSAHIGVYHADRDEYEVTDVPFDKEPMKLYIDKRMDLVFAEQARFKLQELAEEKARLEAEWAALRAKESADDDDDDPLRALQGPNFLYRTRLSDIDALLRCLKANTEATVKRARRA